MIKPVRADRVDETGNAVTDYAARLNADFGWAMDETSDFFEGKGAVKQALREIARRLDELGLDYAVCGGMALNAHDFRRFTEDVDILVTRNTLKIIHDRLEGLGYVPPFKGSKNLRDVNQGVKIEFLVAGDYPGDGKPKPVAFPVPNEVAITRAGIRFISLPKLIELKLASGMTGGVGRLKDLADVVELIRLRKLDETFAEQLNPYVRDKYRELLDGLRQMPVAEE